MNRFASLAAVSLGTFFAASCGSSSTPPTDDAASSDAGGVTIDAACTASAQAQCARRDACSQNHYLIAREYADMATCVMRAHDVCVAGLMAPGTGNTPDNVMTCATMLPTVSCTDFLNGTNLPAACMVQVGTLAMGAACHFSAQCTTSYCSVPTGSECGHCDAMPGVGAACDGPSGVSSCGGHGMTCVGATASPYAAGTCQALVTTVGATCDTMHPCGAGLSCTPVGAMAMNRTCQPAVATVGATCGGLSNPGCDTDQGLVCNTMTHVCAATPLVGPGTACGAGTDGLFARCAAGGTCQGLTSAIPHGTCVAAADDGAACDRSSGPNCEVDASCVTSGTGTAGTCTPASAAGCM